MEQINGMTYEQAAEMVQGTKFKAVSKFKQFLNTEFGYEDMISEIDIAIFKAWKEWKPEESKFNTYVTNRINWGMYRALETYNSTFKMNAMTKNDLKAAGETFETIKVAGKTKDPEFNKEHGLDQGKPFTKDLWNKYVYSVTAKTFGVKMLTQSQFANDDAEGFDIIDVAAQDDAEAHFDMMVEHDITKLDPEKQKIASLLVDGYDIGEVAKEIKISKVKLLQKYAPTERSNKRAVKRLQKA